MPKEKIDHDQLFKNLLQSFFREFMELFFPKEARLLDFSRIEFLDKEYFTDLPKGDRRALDLVVQAGLKGGGDEFVLVHTEFESRKDRNFAERMFCYFAQLYLRHRKRIVPIGLFADDAVWRVRVPRTFRMAFAKEENLCFTYRPIKLKNMSYRDFLGSDNPIIFALMAKMRYSKREMVRLKAEFLRLIAGAKIDEARRGVLFEFVESYMRLDRDHQREFNRLIEEKRDFQEVKKMVTVYEKRGIRKGRKEGFEKGIEKVAKRLLAKGMDVLEVADSTGLEVDEVQKLKNADAK